MLKSHGNISILLSELLELSALRFSAIAYFTDVIKRTPMHMRTKQTRIEIGVQ